MTTKSLKEIVLEAEAENKVVFMTIDGPLSVDIDKFISQPTEGLLKELTKPKLENFRISVAMVLIALSLFLVTYGIRLMRAGVMAGLKIPGYS